MKRKPKALKLISEIGISYLLTKKDKVVGTIKKLPNEIKKIKNRNEKIILLFNNGINRSIMKVDTIIAALKIMTKLMNDSKNVSSFCVIYKTEGLYKLKNKKVTVHKSINKYIWKIT